MVFYTRLKYERSGVLLDFPGQREANIFMHNWARLHNTKLMDCLPYQSAVWQGMTNGREKNNTPHTCSSYCNANNCEIEQAIMSTIPY